MKGEATGQAGSETADVNDRHILSHRLGWTSGRLHPGARPRRPAFAGTQGQRQL
jgi:hypothetical protein